RRARRGRSVTYGRKRRNTRAADARTARPTALDAGVAGRVLTRCGRSVASVYGAGVRFIQACSAGVAGRRRTRAAYALIVRTRIRVETAGRAVRLRGRRAHAGGRIARAYCVALV